MTDDGLEIKFVEVEGTVPVWVVDASSGSGTTPSELCIKNVEPVGRGLALSKVVEVVIGIGKVIDGVELTVYDVTAEVWKAVRKCVEDMSLERTEGLAVL